MNFQFEREFVSAPGVKFAADNWPLAIAIVIIYLMGIQIGQAQMSKRAKPFDLKYPLAAWNAFLCIFSFIGMCKTVSSFIFRFCFHQQLIDMVLLFLGSNASAHVDDHALRTDGVRRRR